MHGFVPVISRRVLRLSEGQNHHCPYCGVVMTGATPDLFPTRDHLVPKSQGGADIDDNLVAACAKCNMARGDRDLVDFLGLQGDEAAELAALLAALPRMAVNTRRVQGALRA